MTGAGVGATAGASAASVSARRRPASGQGSIRVRITSLAAVVLLALLGGTAVLLVVAQQQLLIRNVDDALAERSDELIAELRAGDLPTTGTSSLDEDQPWQLVAADGTLLASSESVAAIPPIGDEPVRERDLLQTVERADADEHPLRVLTRHVNAPSGPAVLHVATSLDEELEAVRSLGLLLVVAAPTVVVVLAAVIWWLVGRTLRPVEQIRSEVARIGRTSLDRRLPEPAGDDEIHRLAVTMNGMLDRVEAAVRREQRFVADASHELRTPLARMRSELGVDLAHPDRADPFATHRSVLDETIDLERTVDDLLVLARTDAGTPGRQGRPVDLDDVVLREADRLRADGRVTLDTAGVSAAAIVGDESLIGHAVRNVLDNAERHAISRVTLTLEEAGAVARLTISDDGHGIPREAHERIFERFARLDESRARDAGGTGLGLAIARDIVERHGGSIAVDPGITTGARFVVTFPLADEPQPG
jgi:signal transduction histidine kinase